MHNKYKILIAIVFLLIFSSIILFSTKEKEISDRKYIEISIRDRKIQTEILDTEEKRVKGLSGVEKIEKDEGKLFVFDNKSYWGIWMKEMLFPIDVIWLDEYGQVVDFKENLQPESYPEVFFPKDTALFVLEVHSGFVKDNNLFIKDKILFNTKAKLP